MNHLSSHSKENFGMGACEAMASGIPIIISDKVGISSDIIKSQAGIVVPPNIDALSEAMIKCLSDKELCNKMVANAYALIMEKYEISKVAKQMIEEYRNIIRLSTNRRREF